MQPEEDIWNNNMHYVLDNAQLWIGDGGRFDGHVIVADGLIQQVTPGRYSGPLPTIDLEGVALSPGLIDLMANGGFGQSFVRDGVTEFARQYLRLGVTSCQTCFGTLPWDQARVVADHTHAQMVEDSADACRIVGLYIEGPFILPECRGGNLAEYALEPTPVNVQKVLDVLGHAVTMINVSPGLDGDVQAIATLTAAGKVVTMAHSNASAQRVLACIEAGTTNLGHAFDNNSGGPSEPGSQQPTLEQVAMVDDRVRFVHLICDGEHVHPLMINLMLRCRGVEAICVITDALPSTGTAQQTAVYDDGQPLVRRGNAWREQGRESLFGTALMLPDQWRHFMKMTGIEPHLAIRTVTFNPAAALGRDREMGLLAAGCCADLVAWDSQLCASRVWRAGREVAQVEDQLG